eukprot:12775170-Alexandrium_andersonii.AAC.1
MKAATVEFAGPPCVAFSSMGKRDGENGSSSIHFLSWIGKRLDHVERTVVHENVEAFDLRLLSTTLGHLYQIQSCIMCPSTLGWPVHRRRRWTA